MGHFMLLAWGPYSVFAGWQINNFVFADFSLVSNRLFEVYEYCRIQVLNAFKRDENSDLEQARMAVEGIKSAWIEIGPQVESRAT